VNHGTNINRRKLQKLCNKFIPKFIRWRCCSIPFNCIHQEGYLLGMCVEDENIADASLSGINLPGSEKNHNISDMICYCIFKQSFLSQSKQSEQTRNAQGGQLRRAAGSIPNHSTIGNFIFQVFLFMQRKLYRPARAKSRMPFY
jgi:hypothetical protein